MPDVASWIRVLRASHNRFSALVSPLDDDAVRAPSYDDGWSIAQVASHLGSQAEIFDMFLDAGLGEGDSPGGEQFKPIWDRWNALDPAAQVADSVRANERFVSRLEGLPAADRQRFSVALFGSPTDLAGLAAARLGEHAVHTWDVAVALDPSAVVAADAAELLVDQLVRTVAHAGKPSAQPRSVVVETSQPQRRFVLTTGPQVLLVAAGADDARPAEVRLTAEALVRLVYGRLDVNHTPSNIGDSSLLEDLRQLFPGF